MKIRAPIPLFKDPETAMMKFDVLNAIINLDRAGDGNWIKVKEWLNKEHEALIPNVIYTIGMPADQSNGLKGMATILGAICFLLQEPKLALNQAQQAQQSAKQRPAPVPPGGIS